MAVRRRLTGYTGFRWLLLAMLGIMLVEALALIVVLPIPLAATPPRLYDFSYYYDAALALRLNPHANVYDPNLIAALARSHHLFYSGGVLGYPLFLPIVIIPLTLFSFRVAALIWYVFNLLLWALNVALLMSWLQSGLRGGAFAGAPGSSDGSGGAFVAVWARAAHSPGGSGISIWRARAAWNSLSDSARFALVVVLFVGVSFAPMIEAQLLGQASMLMLTCFLLMFWLLQRGRSGAAGALLTVVILIKLFPAVLLLYLLILRRWRALLGAAVSLVVLLVGMMAVVGVSGMLSMRSLFSVIASGPYITSLNESLARAPAWISYEVGAQPGTATALLGDLLIASVAIAFGVGLLLWDRRRRRELGARPAPLAPGAGDSLAYGWALCTMFLVTPISQEHYAIWLLPALLFCLGYVVRLLGQQLNAKQQRSPREKLLLFAVALALALNLTALPFGYDGKLGPGLAPYILGHPLRPIFMVVRPLAALLIWGVAGMLLCARAAVSAASAPQGVTAPATMPADAEQASASALYGLTPAVDAVAVGAALGAAPDAIPWRALRSGLLYLLATLYAWQIVIQFVQDVAGLLAK